MIRIFSTPTDFLNALQKTYLNPSFVPSFFNNSIFYFIFTSLVVYNLHLCTLQVFSFFAFNYIDSAVLRLCFFLTETKWQMFKFLLKGKCFLLSTVLKASVLCIGSESGNFYFHFKNLFFIFYAIVLSIFGIFFWLFLSIYTNIISLHGIFFLLPFIKVQYFFCLNWRLAKAIIFLAVFPNMKYIAPLQFAFT